MGRKPTVNIKSDTPEYFTHYYHTHNSEIVCDCKQLVKKYAIYKHRKSQKHILNLEIARLEDLLAKSSFPIDIPDSLGESLLS